VSKFKITCRCNDCGNKYWFAASSPNVADEPCPRCSKTNDVRGLDIAAGKAPSIGGSNAVKAMDIAAEITMADHGLTDLSSDGRPGATMAPPVRPDIQARVDGMFGGGKLPGRMNPIQQRMRQMAAMAGKQGLGAFAPMRDTTVPDPIQMVQAPRTRPAVTLLNPRNKDGSIIT
jgi:hypothetical protein